MQRGRLGDQVLEDRSSRPRRQPHAVAPSRVAAIVAYRQTRATAWEISARVGVPRSTVTRVLQRAGLNRVSRLTPPPVIQRYEWPHAGDLLHLDIKPLGWIRGIGHRIHGNLSVRARGAGYEYAHVAIDDATRVAYVEVRRSQRRRACAAFLTHALHWFRRRGITIRRVLTDNAAGYKCGASPGSVARCSSATASRGLHPAHQREGRALHPNPAARMGLSSALPQLLRTDRGAGSIPSVLQPPPAPRELGPTVSVDPLAGP